MTLQYTSVLTQIYDQKTRVGPDRLSLRYSILRALLFVGPHDDILAEPRHYDFAVLWDADDDRRVVLVAERLYLDGELRGVLALQESRAVLQVHLDENHYAELLVDGKERLERFAVKIADVVRRETGDDWQIVVRPMHRSAPVVEPLDVYLRFVDQTWRLGDKPVDRDWRRA